jgi:hypothetical protein
VAPVAGPSASQAPSTAEEALPAGLAIGGDFQVTGGTTHSGFALFPGTP